MLNHNDIIPLYYQLKDILKDKINNKEWEPNYKLPSERELMEIYQISRSTARKALEELMKEGLIHRKKGIGTFVSEFKISQNLIGELSFNHQAEKQGLNYSSIVLYSGTENNNSFPILKKFNLEASDKVFKIIRIRLINESPLILETLYIPCKYTPNILEQDLATLTVFEYLKEDCNLNFTHSTLNINPVIINDYESKHLETSEDTLGLSLERFVYKDEKIVVIQIRKLRSDLSQLSFSTKIDKENKSDVRVDLEYTKSV